MKQIKWEIMQIITLEMAVMELKIVDLHQLKKFVGHLKL